ncbi:flavodoxin family protein [Nocardia sp. CDC159]|uniref:Flavodoxin family protein n=1 Tax=Nocardia pulmonis TaxID=2951408 RepID=A0A9X2ITQ0_9NOCA|nr:MULTISPECIES: flavodoxin family protein [Nocardia]MCM6772027.1 flavodoxin family protein [Nocardia pulmonis]MCM6785315.1 flavodoxin family protein [Nocardia sp. CDC159]
MTDENLAPPRIVIAYHSGWGHTAVLAAAVAQGARDGGAAAELLAVDRITETDWAALDAADAIVFGSPTYMGDVSAAFKAFAEATSSRCVRGAWQDKVAAGFTNSGGMSGDKLHALISLAVLAAQHHMHWVNLGLVAGWNSTTASRDDLNRLGFFLGAGAQTDTDLPPEGVLGSDLATCRHLGGRVAEVTAQLAAGRLSCRPLRTTER